MSVDALHFNGVSKSFRSVGSTTTAVLRNIDITVRPGESVAILGPSGSGKSTLLRLAAGLEKLDQFDNGSITVDGQKPGTQGVGSALVFQAYSTFPWLTAERNVILALRQSQIPRRDRRNAALELLAIVRLDGHERHYPDQLSGGQRQRLAFACAIALQPSLLLLDEPLGALDPITREHLQLELIRLHDAQACAMLLVTHDISEAVLLGQRVILLSQSPGRILLEVEAKKDKPWLDVGYTDSLPAQVRTYRGGAAFRELTSNLRDALADDERH